MLKPIFGNDVVEKILFYMYYCKKAYASKLANVYDIRINGIQQQLTRLEQGGILVSVLVGRTRMYELNPRYPFAKELIILIKKASEFLPEGYADKYYMERNRPRQKGKPL
ncbi:MAG: hypothetical protein A2452_09500 [Candidatus Firestonebacteria bacterium RIFOXYC2_FULL_39_67]|nr:MAG: hypothetical protein A2536_00090 [Candidatus Firestonebacteria bacterium RIFOXYD2_FULL_39_29]OGF52922.1 MAG: hypothetical protein A2497_00335 [Candidatus Firestonebacteria bacterium RifOxyC12_full_39_7]OGF55747.1 MAG: hypothetical protein A2452_09500 [Candidatus Firestonebacteria bacterium RIFOXYC2_FULL_39_67]